MFKGYLKILPYFIVEKLAKKYGEIVPINNVNGYSVFDKCAIVCLDDDYQHKSIKKKKYK